MNEYFSGTRPDLISMKALNDLAPFIQHSDNFNTIVQNINGGTQSSIKIFYDTYIKPNILPIIIIVIFIGCIILRYLSVHDNKTTNITNLTNSKIENFNPAKPVFAQKNHNKYVEPPMEELKNTQLLYDMDDELFNKIISRTEEPSLNLDNVPIIDPLVSDPLEFREQIHTSNNEWENQSDGLPNPFYGNNYISSTADAVDYTMNINKQNMNMATRQIFG